MKKRYGLALLLGALFSAVSPSLSIANGAPQLVTTIGDSLYEHSGIAILFGIGGGFAFNKAVNALLSKMDFGNIKHKIKTGLSVASIGGLTGAFYGIGKVLSPVSNIYSYVKINGIVTENIDIRTRTGYETCIDGFLIGNLINSAWEAYKNSHVSYDESKIEAVKMFLSWLPTVGFLVGFGRY